jgi:hypothetical protein
MFYNNDTRNLEEELKLKKEIILKLDRDAKINFRSLEIQDRKLEDKNKEMTQLKEFWKLKLDDRVSTMNQNIGNLKIEIETKEKLIKKMQKSLEKKRSKIKKLRKCEKLRTEKLKETWDIENELKVEVANLKLKLSETEEKLDQLEKVSVTTTKKKTSDAIETVFQRPDDGRFGRLRSKSQIMEPNFVIGTNVDSALEDDEVSTP